MIPVPLITKIAGGAALVAILTLATLWQLSERRVDRLQSRLEVAYRDLNQCRANTAGLEASLDAQNQALERIRAAGEARTAQTQERLSALNAEAERLRAEANRLRTRPIQGNTECERMVDVYDSIVRGE
jgi:septal ring factor EnvC (AmiA/AmiB activator)